EKGLICTMYLSFVEGTLLVITVKSIPNIALFTRCIRHGIMLFQGRILLYLQLSYLRFHGIQMQKKHTLQPKLDFSGPSRIGIWPNFMVEFLLLLKLVLYPNTILNLQVVQIHINLRLMNWKLLKMIARNYSHWG